MGRCCPSLIVLSLCYRRPLLIVLCFAAPHVASGHKSLPEVTASADDPKYDRTDVYDALYSKGYQTSQGMNYTQSRQLLLAIHELQLNTALSTALDVGSSHGFGVARLWEMGLRASGADLSGVAVDIARKARGDELALRCVAPNEGHLQSCFQKASVVSLPWPNRSFDVSKFLLFSNKSYCTALLDRLLCLGSYYTTTCMTTELGRILLHYYDYCLRLFQAAVPRSQPTSVLLAVMSSDVLEHVPLPLVDFAVAELSRVARKFLALKISVRHEGVTSQFKAVQKEAKQTNLTVPKGLHETIAHSAWWIAKFSAHGFYRIKRIPTPGHACCAFILVANTTHPAFRNDHPSLR